MSQIPNPASWSKACEDACNKQINKELEAAYAYMIMATYFKRNDVALPNVYKFLEKCSLEEREHAQLFIDYQNKRGGNVVYYPLKACYTEALTPSSFTLLQAFQKALQLEQVVFAAILEMNKVAENDPSFQDYIASSGFYTEQVDAIDELQAMITTIKRCDTKMGELMFDQTLRKNCKTE